MTFKEILQSTYKSSDTEEWLDVHFTRPIGLVIALFCRRLGIVPNAVTIFSIVIGAAAGVLFYFDDLALNVAGILLLMFANFCDSADGQLARLTDNRTLLGRALDGFAENVWFVFIYVALCLRLQSQPIPYTDEPWGIRIWILSVVVGFLCHSPQCSLADYYRQIHLFFLKGEQGSELDSYAQQRAIYDSLPKDKWFDRLFYYSYSNYCRSQERRTPRFQEFFKRVKELPEMVQGSMFNVQGSKSIHNSHFSFLTSHFLAGSRPLMPMTNILTFNTRAISLYISILLNIPWAFLIFEMVVLHSLYIYMHHRHERLCAKMTKMIENA